MAGEEHYDEVIAYLTRLMAQPPPLDEPLRLRSVHRAALTSWARKRNIPLRLSAMGSGTPFSVRDLLGGQAARASDGATPPSSASHGSAPAGAAASAPGGIGIDIEEVDNLPHALDYREHPFYQDNFTSSEIAYCVRQADVRASFCGTWAAKEAVLKSGAAAAPGGQLKNIGVSHDKRGRPIHPGCQLSISHTAKVAVAVCVVSSIPPAVVGPGTAERAKVSDPAVSIGVPVSRKWPWSKAQPGIGAGK